MRLRFNKGISLIEVVVGTAVILLVLTGLIAAYGLYIRAGFSSLNTIQSAYLLEGGVEAVTTLRDQGWSANIANLTIGTNYYLVWNGTRWTAVTTPTLIDAVYDQHFTLGNVYRDANDNIAASGALDSGARLLSVFVSWRGVAGTTTKSVATYLMNLFQ